ncbi:hypothetical protein BCR43DRAFT_506644 [Syncephalastrum racemosum]|uniref:Uncharacterized protein n=1 Tax=Syncephalastrum racemosum TaxID=13706 RepID=A0A1X2H833_SYNRA|nr:hypothetical protein BCR43DRAFT_506644 [Syncephalastrum racemosum]
MYNYKAKYRKSYSSQSSSRSFMDRPPEASETDWRTRSVGSNRTVAQRTSMQDKQSPLAGTRPQRRPFQSTATQQPRFLASDQPPPLSSSKALHDSSSVPAEEDVVNEKAAAQWRKYRESMSPKAPELFPSQTSKANDEQEEGPMKAEEDNNTRAQEYLDDHEGSRMSADDTWDTSSIEDDDRHIHDTHPIRQEWDISNKEWDDTPTADPPQSEDRLQKPPSPVKASYTAQDPVQTSAIRREEPEPDSWKNNHDDQQVSNDFFWGPPPEKDPLPSNINWERPEPVRLPGEIIQTETASEGWRRPLPDAAPVQMAIEEDKIEERNVSAPLNDRDRSQGSQVEDDKYTTQTQSQDIRIPSSEVSTGGWDTSGAAWDPPAKKPKSVQKQNKLNTPEPSGSAKFASDRGRFEFIFDDPDYVAVSSTDYSIIYHCPSAAAPETSEASPQSSASPVPSSSSTSPPVANAPRRSQTRNGQRGATLRGSSPKQTQRKTAEASLPMPDSGSPFFYPQYLSEPPPEFRPRWSKPSKPKTSPAPPSK